MAETLKELDRARQAGVSVTWDVIPKYAYGPFHHPMAASLFHPYVGAVRRLRRLFPDIDSA